MGTAQAHKTASKIAKGKILKLRDQRYKAAYKKKLIQLRRQGIKGNKANQLAKVEGNRARKYLLNLHFNLRKNDRQYCLQTWIHRCKPI